MIKILIRDMKDGKFWEGVKEIAQKTKNEYHGHEKAHEDFRMLGLPDTNYPSGPKLKQIISSHEAFDDREDFYSDVIDEVKKRRGSRDFKQEWKEIFESFN